MATTPKTDTRLTYDDYVLIPEDGLRHEVIDGVDYVTPSPATRHQRLVARLFLAVGGYLEQRPDVGEAFVAPFDVVFSKWDVVEPDLLFVATDQNQIVTDANIQGAPALVVEILSPATRKRDFGIKRQLFDRGGVQEYWIVDPENNGVTVHRRNGSGSLLEVAQLSGDEIVTTPLLPGFSLALSKLFAE